MNNRHGSRGRRGKVGQVESGAFAPPKTRARMDALSGLVFGERDASLCQCNHGGDCEPGAVSMHAGAIGHGSCLVPGCGCLKFTFQSFRPGWGPEKDGAP